MGNDNSPNMQQAAACNAREMTIDGQLRENPWHRQEKLRALVYMIRSVGTEDQQREIDQHLLPVAVATLARDRGLMIDVALRGNHSSEALDGLLKALRQTALQAVHQGTK